jgi:hypothetical protein
MCHDEIKVGIRIGGSQVPFRKTSVQVNTL